MCVNSLQISEFILNVCFPFGGEADYHIWCRIIDWLLVLSRVYGSLHEIKLCIDIVTQGFLPKLWNIFFTKSWNF